MSQNPPAIPKNPQLSPAEDFYRLRREGIGFIEQMGSRLWTDYNTHDPGITILDALCYAMTDLAYRIGWDIKDLLTPQDPPQDPARPFPDQAFFTAREILTVNPWTPDDFRRLLIDLEGVRNAWMHCKACACDLHYYAWCEDDELRLAYQKPVNPVLQPVKVFPTGLYEVLLELEEDPELGDLNNRKIEHRYTIFDNDGRPHEVVMELRFPPWGLDQEAQWQNFLDNGGQIDGVTITLGATKDYDVLTDGALSADQKNAYLRDQWRNVLYVSFDIDVADSADNVMIRPVSLRLFGDTTAKKGTTLEELKKILEDGSPAGVLQRYRQKLLKIGEAVAEAKASLHRHRNLDEDYCRVSGVQVEEVAVCADVEVAPDADIEAVQAQIWFEIEQYFNPPIRFYTLEELMNEGIPVEEIFNGPALNSGFVKSEELEAATLKDVLRTSDIINRLMDIEGVIAVNNLILSKYDAEGRIVKGAADPQWVNGTPVFDAEKSSAAWLLFISDLHQPRLYHRLSRFLFYKDGLPFLPRLDEVADTLTQLRGEAERPKIKNAPNDLPIPAGTFRDPQDYFPVQYSLPLTYGVGTDGLPSHVSDRRRAQARQLKAYLMVYEQYLGNALAQLAHTADLFSLRTDVERTYFIRLFDEDTIRGYDDIMTGSVEDELLKMTETEAEFLDRRNRLLNHLMARFGEQFGEYALLLSDLQGQQIARHRLIDDKIAFLKAYPRISHDRGRAFDYTVDACAPDNIPGLKKRISLLLGFPDLSFVWTIIGTYTITDFQLVDSSGGLWMEGSVNITESEEAKAKRMAFQQIITQMMLDDAYEIVAQGSEFQLRLNDEEGNPLATSELFGSSPEAQNLKTELLAWSSQERAIVVEHLLLRPKFPGDALYPACSEGSCKTCGEEDPYSFRLTFVMPGWTEPFNVNMEMRRFADRSIRRETPSHLLAKICWVGNDGFIENPCDPVLDELAELLQTQGMTDRGDHPSETEACDCAATIYQSFSEVFRTWYEDKTLDFFQADALLSELEGLFAAQVEPTDITCSTLLEGELWDKVQELMLRYFHFIALYGWQFERFEDAWCTWLDANAVFDWTEERLQERLEAILHRQLIPPDMAKQKPLPVLICECATDILTRYGTDFYNWMQENLLAGKALDELSEFDPQSITLCQGLDFKDGTVAQIEQWLRARYDAYVEVSYRLWVVVDLLSKLRNTYPGATLHDCDDGSDENPVRLGSTALGNYAMRRSLTSDTDNVTEPTDRSLRSGTASRAPAKTPRSQKAKPLLDKQADKKTTSKRTAGKKAASKKTGTQKRKKPPKKS